MATPGYNTVNVPTTKLWEKKLGVPIEGVAINEVYEEIWVRTRDIKGGPLVSLTFKGKKNGRLGQGAVTSSGAGIYTDRARDCMVVTQRNRILVLDRLGYKVKEVLVPGAASLQGIVHCVEDNSYLVADSGVHCVWRVDARTGENQKLSDQGRPMNSPEFLCKSEDTLVVSDCNNHEIKWLDPAGNVSRTSGMSFNSIGRLEFPRGVCFDHKGTLLVCDQDNMRVIRISGNKGVEKYDILLTAEQLDGQKPCCIVTTSTMLVVGLKGSKGRLVSFSYNV